MSDAFDWRHPEHPAQIVMRRHAVAARHDMQTKCLEAVYAEPEFPGDMPDEMLRALGAGDKDAIAQALRLAVQLTKSNIAERIQGIDGYEISVANEPEAPPEDDIAWCRCEAPLGLPAGTCVSCGGDIEGIMMKTPHE